MGIGFEVTNDNGSKQVIDTAPLLTFRENLESQRVNSAGYKYVTAKYLLAVKPFNNNSLVLTTTRINQQLIDPDDNDNYKYRIVGEGEVVRFHYGVAPSNTDQFGLQIFSESGELQYESSQKALKVLDVVQLDDIRASNNSTNNNTVYWSKSYAGKDVAAIIIQGCIWNKGNNLMCVSLHKSGTVYDFRACVQDTDSFYGEGVVSSYKFYALVVDVTNY